ncbi:hypothetical protein PFISCL1PPCAC_17306, partial [Pristionchus fissidentatus]
LVLSLLLAVFLSEALKILPPPGLKPAKERFNETSPAAALPTSEPPKSNAGGSTLTVLKKSKRGGSSESSSHSRETIASPLSPYTVTVTHAPKQKR